MLRFRVHLSVAISLATVLAWVAPLRGAEMPPDDAPVFDEQQIEFFEKKVRPILVQRCYECHGPESDPPGGGLYLTSRAALLAGGDTGQAIVAGQAQESLLIESVRYEGLYQMPPKSRLPEEEVAILTQWVDLGAPWPAEPNNPAPRRETFNLQQRQSEHWAWQPIEQPDVPPVTDTAWPLDPLDHFVLARLEGAQVRPNPPAERAILLRRIYFDLTGLPPTPEQVEQFLADDSPDAVPRVVDQLLASPRFGEHWGRHWLDLVRYAESRGHEFDHDIANAYQYRDYIIRALNADVPYNDLVIEHLAGDLLETPRIHPQEGFNESVLGTGFWHLGDWVHSPVDIRKDETERQDNMLDVMNKAFLGLTVSCARCHDHKFDAISQSDYYAQAGFLQSSSYRQVRFETEAHNRQIARTLAKLDWAAQDEARQILQRQLDAAASQLQETFTHLLGGAAVSPDTRPWQEALHQARLDPAHPLHGWGRQLAGESVDATVPTDDARPAGVQIVHDMGQLQPEQFRTDGPTFGLAPQLTGQLRWGRSPDNPLVGVRTDSAVVYDRRWAGLGASEGVRDDAGVVRGWNRAGRTFKTNTFSLVDGRVHYLVRGAGRVFAVVDSHRLVAGPLHGITAKKWDAAESDEPRWITHDLRDYQAHRIHLEFTPHEDNPLEILLIAEGPQPPPQPANIPFTPLKPLAASTPEQSAQELVETLRRSLADAALAPVADWLVNHWHLVQEDGLAELAPLYKRHQAETDALLAKVRWKSRTAPAMWDSSAEDEQLLIRGHAHSPAEPVERRLLTAIPVSQTGYDPNGSGRLQLARQMMSPENPFAARVAVNRIWHHLMGRGIVRSVDNFGVLGETPTHPLLLDHLATRFMAEGWSLKKMIRTVVLSRTYQMSSQQSAAAAEIDAKNDLFHRAHVKRLSGEAIRDNLLAASGQLDLTMYGPSVPVHLTSFMQGRGRPGTSGPLDGNGRRSIYLESRRNFFSPWMLAFDTPQPITTIGRRNQSNVPAQSLILLNDPLVHQQCEHWARRAIALVPHDAQARFEQMVLQAFSRPPTADEHELASEFLESHAETLEIAPDERLQSVPLWRDLAHVLVNAKPFIYIH